MFDLETIRKMNEAVDTPQEKDAYDLALEDANKRASERDAKLIEGFLAEDRETIPMPLSIPTAGRLADHRHVHRG
jgi:hypothetical protein